MVGLSKPGRDEGHASPTLPEQTILWGASHNQIASEPRVNEKTPKNPAI